MMNGHHNQTRVKFKAKAYALWKKAGCRDKWDAIEVEKEKGKKMEET